MWYTFYKRNPRLRNSGNSLTLRTLLHYLVRGYRLKITHEPLDLKTLRPMCETLRRG